jgi:hypothetical protein
MPNPHSEIGLEYLNAKITTKGVEEFYVDLKEKHSSCSF